MIDAPLRAGPELIAFAVASLLIPVSVGYWAYRDANGWDQRRRSTGARALLFG